MPFHRQSNPNKGPQRRSLRTRGRPGRGWVRGVVDGIDPDHSRLEIRVDDGSRIGRRLVGSTVAVDAGGAELALPDGDGDGRPSLRDVFPGNPVEVRFSGGLEPPLSAVKVIYRGGEAPVGGLRRLWS